MKKDMNINVFVTRRNSDQLVKVMKSAEEPYNCGNELRIKEVSRSRGEYAIEKTFDCRTCETAYIFRVIGGKILSDRATPFVEGVLREKRIPFEMYKQVPVNIKAKQPKITLPEKPDLTYTPQKH